MVTKVSSPTVLPDAVSTPWSTGANFHSPFFFVTDLAPLRSVRVHGLLRALYRIALQQGEKTEPLFDTVIMAAPDFDARLFTEQIAPRIRPLSASWTLYTSDNDSALDLSALFSSAKRLGKYYGSAARLLPQGVGPRQLTVLSLISASK